MIRNSIPIIAMLALAVAILGRGDARAQTSSPLLVTWRANAYAPAAFSGKILAPRGGSVTATVDFLVNGKPADLSNREIRWFVGNELYRSGKNMKRFTFQIPVQNSDEILVKAVVIGAAGGITERVVSIPISSPVVVIEVPSEGGYIPAAPVAARAVPYFFSIEKPDDLSYEWSANGSVARSSADVASAVAFDASGGAPGNSVILGVRAVNPNAAVESARASVSLRIK